MSSPNPWTENALERGVIQLATSDEDKRHVREAFIRSLATQTDQRAAELLMTYRIPQLNPTIADLSTCHTWIDPPTLELLAAVRRNSTLAEWLTVLPMLAPAPS